MKQTRQAYVSPGIEVIELENEGVIAASLDQSAGGYETTPWSAAPSSRGYGVGQSATSSDIEGMLEDIFQVNN